MGNEKAEFQEVHFHRLPEELLLYILHRVSDLKSLCLCSLVSKYFASVISHVRTIRLTLPSNEAHSKESYKRTLTLFHEIRHLKREEIPEFLDLLSLQKLKLPVFLEKFRKLESVYLEYKLERKLGNSSLIMWKAKSSSSAMIENLVALLPASLHKMTEYKPDQEQMSQENNRSFVSSQINDCLWPSLGRYTEWLCLICMLTKSHSSLKSVTVTDSEKQDKLVIKDEELVYIRSCLHEGEREEISIKSIMKVAWVRLLHLPLSGYIMRGVCLLMLKVPTESCATSEYDDITGWDFEEHENVLGEAVKEILKNHPEMIKTFYSVNLFKF